MIKFKKVSYQNFLSSGNTPTVIKLNDQKTTLIVGQNGAGKSTVLDAISFALFGRAHRNINKPQLVNSINGKGCKVEVEFTVGKNDYRIVRTIKPSSFEIYANGDLLNQNSHNKEYQKVLENNILKLTHKTFHQVVVLGSSSFTPFMQLGAYQRRDVIEDLLDIGVFSKMNMILKEKNAVLREKVNQTLHGIEINQTKTEAQKKYIRDLSKINNDVRKEKEESILKFKNEKLELASEIAELSKKNTEVGDVINSKWITARDSIKDLDKAETETLTTIKKLVKDAQFYEKNETCPTCEQDIDDQLKERKLQESKIEATELQSRLTQIKDNKESATSHLEDCEAELKVVTDRSHKIFSNQERIDRLDREIEHAQSDIEDDKSHGDLAEANADYDKLTKEYNELVDTKSTLNDQYAYNGVILEMLKDTGIKTKIIKQYLPVMNNLVNQYLQILDFYVHFDLDESFTETIRSRHRDAFSYDSFSEGEKQRIDLALLFTWRQVAKMKNSIATNLLILDETFDSSLDEAGIENLMKIIHTLGDDTNIFVISHKGEVLDGKFANKIEFVKDKNFSKIAETA
jgi:DNA repair exonuclease SbcCD ATPase subunit